MSFVIILFRQSVQIIFCCAGFISKNWSVPFCVQFSISQFSDEAARDLSASNIRFNIMYYYIV